jgi:hypothetical protein
VTETETVEERDSGQEPGNLLLAGYQTNMIVLIEVSGLVKPVAEGDEV